MDCNFSTADTKPYCSVFKGFENMPVYPSNSDPNLNDYSVVSNLPGINPEKIYILISFYLIRWTPLMILIVDRPELHIEHFYKNINYDKFYILKYQ